MNPSPRRVVARYLLANSFAPAPGGRLLGYKVMAWDPKTHEAVSGANSSLRTPLRKGLAHKMPGVGVFLGATREYVLRHYAHHEFNVLITYTFDPKDLVRGNLTDREPEISVTQAKVVGWEVFDEDLNPVG